jgi:hypothetical protein|eukprot:COSAG06_NODE_2544_length_6701_cov_3.102545_5_plen_213_part_00
MEPSLRAAAAVDRVGTKGSGGVTARQLVQILDLMGVISNEAHAAGLMAEIGYAQINGPATIYPTRSLDQLAEHLSKDGTKVALPGRAAYRASGGPTAKPAAGGVQAAPAAAGSNDYRRGGMPQGQPQAGMSVAARLKAEFDQHKQHLQEGIDKRKSPAYLEERARLAVRSHVAVAAVLLSHVSAKAGVSLRRLAQRAGAVPARHWACPVVQR